MRSKFRCKLDSVVYSAPAIIWQNTRSRITIRQMRKMVTTWASSFFLYLSRDLTDFLGLFSFSVSLASASSGSLLFIVYGAQLIMRQDIIQNIQHKVTPGAHQDLMSSRSSLRMRSIQRMYAGLRLQVAIWQMSVRKVQTIRAMGNTLQRQKAVQKRMQLICTPKMRQISVLRVQVGKELMHSWMTPTEAISSRITLKRKLFIHVSFCFMGWNRQQQGMRMPNFMLPFCTHHSMYKQKYANTNVPIKPAFAYSSLISSSFSQGISGRSPVNFLAILPKMLRQVIEYICTIHRMEVMKNMMPRMSFSTGMMGLVSAYLSYSSKSWYYQLRAQYLALNSVSTLPTLRLSLNFWNHPAYQFLLFLSSSYFSYQPYFSRLLIAAAIFSLVFFISAVFLALGRCLNSLIMSMGSANSPTPPKIITKIHPKNDKMAMMQTASEVYNVMEVQLTVGATTVVPVLLALSTTSVQGMSTNLKNAQLMKSTMTVMMMAPTRQASALSMRLQMFYYSSVSQRKMAQGMNTETNTSTMIYMKNQKARMSMEPGTRAVLLATSRGTIRACAWHRVSPRMTRILQQTAVPQPLSSGWMYRISRQMLTASSTIIMTTISTIRQAYIWLTIQIFIISSVGRAGCEQNSVLIIQHQKYIEPYMKLLLFGVLGLSLGYGAEIYAKAACSAGEVAGSLGLCLQPRFIQGCHEYESSGTCKVCEYNYKLDTNGLCSYERSSAEHCCALKNDQGMCTKCREGLQLFDGVCKATRIIGCLQRDKSGQCINCASDHYLSQGLCHPGVKDCQEYLETGDEKKSTCVKCKKSFSLVNNACLKNKILGCQTQLNSQCQKCHQPFALKQGHCEIANCVSYNDFGCTACDCGYFLNDKNTCEQIQAGCIRYIRGVCSDCQTGFKLQRGACIIEGCEEVQSLQCVRCSKGYELRNGTCKLPHCSQGNEGVCFACDIGYVPQKGQCIRQAGQNISGVVIV